MMLFVWVFLRQCTGLQMTWSRNIVPQIPILSGKSLDWWILSRRHLKLRILSLPTLVAIFVAGGSRIFLRIVMALDVARSPDGMESLMIRHIAHVLDFLSLCPGFGRYSMRCHCLWGLGERVASCTSVTYDLDNRSSNRKMAGWEVGYFSDAAMNYYVCFSKVFLSADFCTVDLLSVRWDDDLTTYSLVKFYALFHDMICVD